MGLRDLFIEEVPDEGGASINSASIDDILNDVTSYAADAVVPGAETQDVVADTYAANGLTDISKSIFKVEELMETLPAEMQTTVKRTTVASILSSFQLTVDEVVADGNNRIATLDSVKSTIVNDAEADIASTRDYIEDLKRQIAEKEQEIAQTQELIKSTDLAISTEVGRINGLLNFIQG